MSKAAVVLFNLGGPDNTDAVKPFLKNLFSDKYIFKLPFQKTLAKLIAYFRSPKVIKQYELIGGKSPIGKWTEFQRASLEKQLRDAGKNVDVYTAMRYWKPFLSEALSRIEAHGYNQIILLPLFPHFSVTTTASSFSEWDKLYQGNRDIVERVYEYCENEKYIKTINNKIDETIKKFPGQHQKDITLVFSAHGTPVSLVMQGDPYSHHIRSTVKAVMKARKHDLQHTLCFQSKVGPAEWLTPSTDSAIEELAKNGKNHLLVVPISFVSDHIETSFELDIEYRHVAEENGIENYIVMEGFNDSPLFIDTLSELVLKKLDV